MQEDLGNVTMNINYPSEPQEHPSTASRSLPSTSTSNSLTLTTVQGLGRIVGTTRAAPLAITLGMTQGFRNAPTLYGDTTVRPATDVTGWRSGIKTAGKEFGLGMYDGLSGILTQLYHGAKKEGSSGLVKGVGKGLAGVIVKPDAGESMGVEFIRKQSRLEGYEDGILIFLQLSSRSQRIHLRVSSPRCTNNALIRVGAPDLLIHLYTMPF